MTIHDLRPTPTNMRLAPVGPTSAPIFSFALLTFACALASFAFACATPFAAFAVVAVAMLPFSSALLVVQGVAPESYRRSGVSSYRAPGRGRFAAAHRNQRLGN